jgi:hypothetical protein
MWPFLLHYPLVEAALGFVIMNCRPRQIALLLAVLVALICHGERADRAIELVCTLSSRKRRPKRNQKALPPGSSP